VTLAALPLKLSVILAAYRKGTSLTAALVVLAIASKSGSASVSAGVASRVINS